MHEGLDHAALVLRDVSVSFGRRVALERVSLAVMPGELVALVGPNGAGKSTLMRAAVGLVACEGEVVVHGRHPRAAAYVPQRASIEADFPILVRPVVASGLRALRRPLRLHRADRQAVVRCLARVGLDGLEDRPIGGLSGGELQRVLIARALAQAPDLLLLDEPLTGVDVSATAALADLFVSLAAEGAAVLVASHDLALVRDRFARCVALNRQVIADGRPLEVLRGETLESVFVPAT